jgi:cysteine desulfuration protein SufE
MFEECLQKQQELLKIFSKCKTPEEKYAAIIELGRTQKPLSPQYKIDANRVHGCQSTMYLVSSFKDKKMYFESESDALISAGLGQILCRIFSGEAPEVVLKCPLEFIEKLDLLSLLSPGRANGFSSLYLRMKQEALKALVQESTSKST